MVARVREHVVEVFNVVDAGTSILGLAAQLHPQEEESPMHGRMQWLYRTAPLLAFGGGTNEVQRTIIATLGCGLPRK